MGRAPAAALRLGLSISGKLCWNRKWTLALLASLVMPCAGPAVAQLRPPYGVTVPPPAGAPGRSNWVLTPSLQLRETYTDNVFLSPTGLQRSDWITQAIPRIALTANRPRLRFDGFYAPEIVYHAQTQREEKVFHRGNAVGTLELADQLLFLEGGARVDQYDVSLQGPLTTSNVNITGNRSTAAATYVSPYLVRNIGSAARAEARLTYSRWESDHNQQALPDNTARRAHLQLTNGPAYRLLTWDVAYSKETIKYETQQETTSEELTANGKRRITQTVSLLGLAGYESYHTGPQALAEPRWSAGFEWASGLRTRLAVTAGQRLNDQSYSFQFDHRTRLSTWNVTYAEDVTTSRQQFFIPVTQSTASALDQILVSQFPDPVARQKAVQDVIARMGLPPSLGSPINFFSDQLFLQKRWLASVGLHGTRNTLVGTAFWQLRELVETTLAPAGDFAASQSIRTSGASAAWGLRLTPRTTWNLQAGYSRSAFLDSGQVDHFSYLQAGLTRQFQPRVSGSLSYRLQDKQSTQAGAEYRENAGVASLLMMF